MTNESDSTSQDDIIWDAEFNPAVTTYWLLNGCLLCVVTIVGIPILPIWFLVGKWLTGMYLDSHRCTLTSKSLKVSKGVLVRVEKTVPLDRITDLGVVQGPIMRYFDIEALSVETAGQSSAGSLINLAGIKDGRKFRDAVLKQRDVVSGSTDSETTHVANESGESVQVLREILATMQRIETRLNEKSSSE